MLDAFLKRHADELLNSVISPCLVLKQGNEEEEKKIQKLPVDTLGVLATDEIIDNKPLIGDTIADDPFQTLFQNSNQEDTRFKDRNNIYNKKGHMPK